jgi:tetratricopeptide (TPR) repeat protein
MHQLAETYKALACAYYACVLQDAHADRSARLVNDSKKYFDDAEELELEVIGISKKLLGHSDPQVLSSQSALAATYVLRRQYHQAEQVYREVLDARKTVHGIEHPKTLLVKENLATCLRYLGRMEEAEEMSQDVVLAHAKCAPEKGDSAMQQCVEIWQSEWLECKFFFDDSDNDEEWTKDRERMVDYYFLARPAFKRLYCEALSTYYERRGRNEL